MLVRRSGKDEVRNQKNQQCLALIFSGFTLRRSNMITHGYEGVRAVVEHELSKKANCHCVEKSCRLQTMDKSSVVVLCTL